MSTLPPDYPIEYIDGKVTFFGRDYIVTPDVLIPRLETESLVRRARQLLSVPVMSSEVITEPRHLAQKTGQDFSIAKITETDFLHSKGQSKSIVVDIGCGSGIIGTSVADLADEVIFLDISPEALAVARENFRTHHPEKRAQFIVSDLLDKLPLQREYREAGRDLVSEKKSPLPPFTKGVTTLFLTNLPYIKAEDWTNMSADTVHEPRLALFGGEETGFEMYERLFTQLSALTNLPTYQHTNILFEFGFDQREVAEVIVKQYPQWEYSFFADYAGIERFGEVSIRS